MLVELFLTHAPTPRPKTAELEAALAAVLARARDAHPRLAADEAAFVTWLAPRAGNDLLALPVEELALAFACSRGDTEALHALDARYLSRLGGAIRRVDPSPEFEADVLQRLREKLFVGPPPRIGTYGGSGPLVSWLRAAAVREALNARRPLAREAEAETEALEAIPLSGPDPELLLIRTQHRAAFSEAFRGALAALTPRERTVLRLQTLDGLSLERIGELYGVNKSTVSRWLAHVHEVLLTTTKASLARRLALDDAQLDSLLRAMRSNLELSLARLLPPDGP